MVQFRAFSHIQKISHFFLSGVKNEILPTKPSLSTCLPDTKSFFLAGPIVIRWRKPHIHYTSYSARKFCSSQPSRWINFEYGACFFLLGHIHPMHFPIRVNGKVEMDEKYCSWTLFFDQYHTLKHNKE